ncbi:MAG TPA: hypothetical protein VG738_00645 [Chitinophagaceae bacterium]|nr:hypothetical protein [Chitinophagaceae bacterium]
MKTKYSLLLTIIFAAVACAGLVTGCKKPTDNITWSVNTDVYKSPILIRFVNANSNSTTQPDKFTVQISGKDADKVLMGSGGTDFKTSNGFLPLALDASANPSPENPVIFNVYANIPGFAPVSQTFMVTSDTTPVDHTILALEYAHPADGTSVLQKSTSLNSGVAPATSLQTSTTSTMTETSTITIDDGTQMMDENHNVINASSLQSSIVHFGTSTQSSMLAFPGGFNPVDVERDGQEYHEVTFKTGGFLSIKMKAGNSDVKFFSKPITVSAELNAELINPETDQPVQVGDTIPIWSMNEQTGQWKYETTSTVVLDGSGKISLQFQASHLSCWNIDWWFYSPCRNALRVTVRIGNPALRPQYELVLVDANGQYLGGLYTDATWATVATLYDGLVTVIPRVPNIGRCKLVCYTRRGDPTSKIAETAFFNPCTAGAVTITINPPAPPQMINVKLFVQGKCTNKKVVANVGAWVFLYKLNAPWWQWQIVYINRGQAAFQLENGATYFVATYYGGGYYTTTGTFNKNDTNFPQENGLGGTATYNAATNTVTAFLTFNLNCP